MEQKQLNTLKTNESETVFRTPNPDCPACVSKKQHIAQQWKKYHPLAGTGIQEDTRPINKAAKKVKDS